MLLIRQVAEYIVGGGGKRLRPMLLLLSAGAFGYRGPHRHELAAVVEFIHTATLLHDDVVDESGLRRGRATANALFGNAAAVLVGDFVYSRAFQMMVEVDSMRVLQVLADATNVIAEGEVMQLMNCHNPDIDENGYLEVIRCKTAKLFEAATRLGAILGAAPRGEEDAIADYGTHLGTAFQLIDDVLDYSGDHGGDRQERGRRPGRGQAHAAADLRHQAWQPGAGATWCGAPSSMAGATSSARWSRRSAPPARSTMPAGRRAGSPRAACDALARLPHSTEREYLLQLADFAVTRSY